MSPIVLKFLIFNKINPAANTAITIYIQAWKRPLFFILLLSPDENAFIQFDKLNPASGVTAPERNEAKDARKTSI